MADVSPHTQSEPPPEYGPPAPKRPEWLDGRRFPACDALACEVRAQDRSYGWVLLCTVVAVGILCPVTAAITRLMLVWVGGFVVIALAGIAAYLSRHESLKEVAFIEGGDFKWLIATVDAKHEHGPGEPCMVKADGMCFFTDNDSFTACRENEPVVVVKTEDGALLVPVLELLQRAPGCIPRSWYEYDLF